MALIGSDEPLVVVFGGAGYIGCPLVKALLGEGYRVRIYDNFLYGHHVLETLAHPLLEVVDGDICDVSTVSRAVIGADTVVLLAAIVGRRFADIQYSHFREVNFLASSVVLDAAVEHGVKRFIFASTDSVYGEQSGVIYETATPEPVSLYSRLKLRMEERVIRRKRREFHPCALRIATCYGYSPRMRFDLAPNSLVRDAVLTNELHIDSGESCRAFIHVEDAARAILSAIKAHVNLVSGEIFNLGAQGQSYTLSQLANMLKTVHPEVNITIGGNEPDLLDYRLSCSKIGKILDFAPQWTVQQSMTRLRGMLLEGQFPNPYSLIYQNT